MILILVGKSMRPEFGIFNIVKIVSSKNYVVGDVVEFAFHGYWGIFGIKYVHRIIGIDGDKFLITGDNAKNIDVVPFKWVIGKVVKHWVIIR